jgi:hypothetical protein
MNHSATRARRFGSLLVMAIIVDFVLIATIRAVHTLAPPEIRRSALHVPVAEAAQAQAYALDRTVAPGFIDQAFPVDGGQIPLPPSRRLELPERVDIDVYGWAVFSGPPVPQLASVTYATIDGHFSGAGEPYSRPDVAMAYHDAKFDASGFIIRIRVKTLAKGAHVLRVFVCDAAAKERRLFAAPVTLVVP